jgi:hypothetical protein
MPVAKINWNLPLKKAIDIVDCYEYDNFGMKKNPIMQKFDFDSYPTIIVNGMKVTDILSEKQLKNFLDGFFEGDKIVPEEPEFMKDLDGDGNN